MPYPFGYHPQKTFVFCGTRCCEGDSAAIMSPSFEEGVPGSTRRGSCNRHYSFVIVDIGFRGICKSPWVILIRYLFGYGETKFPSCGGVRPSRPGGGQRIRNNNERSDHPKSRRSLGVGGYPSNGG